MYEFKLRESEPFYSNLPEYLDWDIWEYVNGDDPIRFFAEDGMSPDDSITTRYPYYQMRGNPLSTRDVKINPPQMPYLLALAAFVKN